MEGATQLVSIVGQLVGEEYRQLRGVGQKVAELRDELASMNAVLRINSEADDGVVDHFVREWMKQVRELAYDAEDCVHLYIFRIRCRPRDRFLVWSKRMLTTFFPRRRLAHEIEALRARAVVISERHARYGVKAPCRFPSLGVAPAPRVMPTALGPIDYPYRYQRYMGITKQVNTLAEEVNGVRHNETDMQLKVFFLVGFVGIGKTTLATEVCRQLEGEFQHQAQVSASQVLDGTNKGLTGFLKRLLQQIMKPKAGSTKGVKEEDPLGGIDEMGVDDLAHKLKKFLKDTRYLIVVDDVSTVETWHAIRSKLRNDYNSSRIIVTTRYSIVAEACSDAQDCIHNMERLSFEDSEKLFVYTFRHFMGALPMGVDAEMHKILEKCAQLPMAIISIAGILANYNSSESRDMWERVCNSIGDIDRNPTLEGMRRIITLSYNHLHHYLKGCMIYFSIFPEDYVITKDRLLKRWIAEGLVAEVQGSTLMEVAEAYYNELASRRMIDHGSDCKRMIDHYSDDIVTHYGRRAETCRVHNMVLEVMVSKSLEANFVSLVCGMYEGMSYDRIRRLSIHSREEATKDSPYNKTAARHARKIGIEGMNMEHVRSLSIFGPEDHRKVFDHLGDFTLLRVLDLEDCMGIENRHLRYVCRMYLLRFLSLKGTAINKMPEEVGDLENLETLDVRRTGLEDLPKTVSKLEKLEHISHDGWTARKGVGRMKALRKVSKLVLGYDTNAAQEIGELQQLRELGIHVNLTDMNNPHHQDVNQKLVESLSKTNSLRWLDISSDPGLDMYVLDLLDDIRSPRLLQYLRISGKISKLPNWIGELKNLVELFISWTYLTGDQLFGPICMLAKLKHMMLEANYYKDPTLVAHAHGFPALKDVHVNFDIEGMEVLEFEDGSMEKLETLSVRFLHRQSKRVFGIEHLKSLTEVKLAGKKGNPALDRAVQQLKTVNKSRPESNQIKVAVKYE